MSEAVIEYESARSPVPQEISGPVLRQFVHPKKEKRKLWVYRKDKEKLVTVLHGSDATHTVRQTSETMDRDEAEKIAYDGRIGGLRETTLNSGEVSVTIEGDETLADVYQ